MRLVGHVPQRLSCVKLHRRCALMSLHRRQNVCGSAEFRELLALFCVAARKVLEERARSLLHQHFCSVLSH
eukprot:3361938-Rhodomonas_salina.2